MPIEDELQYITVSNIIEERFIDKSGKPHGKYRFLWEIYILSRCIEQLSDEFGAEKEVQQLNEDFELIFGISPEKKMRIADFLKAFKFSAGTKFEQSGAITPTVSVERSNANLNEKKELSDRGIASLRERVRKAISARGAVFVVLIDRIDDFVVDLEYVEQRKSVQALVECSSFYRFPELKVKLFLRTDLYERIDYAKIGYDKLSAQVVFLEWTDEDICEFVGRRLSLNYERLKIKTKIDFDPELLDVDPSVIQRGRRLMRKPIASMQDLSKTIAGLFTVALQWKWGIFRKSKRTSRTTNLQHEVSKALITLFFPAQVSHCTETCKIQDTEVTDFLATHFKLGGKSPNPRLIVMSLQSVFENSADYYRRNPDKKTIEANALGEYEVLHKNHVHNGYKHLQDVARKTIAELNPKWKPFVENLFRQAKTPKTCTNISFVQLKDKCKWDGADDEFRQFTAFFTHVGLLIATDASVKLEDRFFSFPLVLQKCH